MGERGVTVSRTTYAGLSHGRPAAPRVRVLEIWNLTCFVWCRWGVERADGREGRGSGFGRDWGDRGVTTGRYVYRAETSSRLSPALFQKSLFGPALNVGLNMLY